MHVFLVTFWAFVHCQPARVPADLFMNMGDRYQFWLGDAVIKQFATREVKSVVQVY